MNDSIEFYGLHAPLKRLPGDFKSTSQRKSFDPRLCFVCETNSALAAVVAHRIFSGRSQRESCFCLRCHQPEHVRNLDGQRDRCLDRNGLHAELVHISSGAIAIQALVGGSVHAALGASNAVVAAIIKGAPIIAVGSNTSRPGMQLWVQPDIQRAEQLQGKTLAITRFGSTSDFVTRLIMRKLNLEGKAELRQFGGVVEADVGFRAGQAEGRVSSQAPGPKAKMLVDAAELGIPFSMNLLAVSNDFYRRSPKTVERIVASYIEGIAALKTRKAQGLKVLEKYMGQRGGSAEQHYEFVTKYLDAIPRVDPAAIETVLEMVGQKSPPKVQLFDNAIVDRLAQEGFIDRLYKGGKS